jgi:hypothetical protein
LLEGLVKRPALAAIEREMPLAAASREIEATKVAKSPPHWAAEAGVGRRSTKITAKPEISIFKGGISM